MSERGLTPQRLIRDRGQSAGRPVQVGQRGEAIRQGSVVQASGLRAFGSVVERLAGTAGRMFEAEARKEAEKAERVSAQAGEQWGADADLADLDRLPVGDTIGERAFRKAALVAAGSTAEVQIREIVAGLEAAHEAQPEKFRRLLDAEARGFVGKLPAEMQGPARETFTRLGISSRTRLQDAQRRHRIDGFRAQLMRDTQSLVVSTAQEARRGDYQDAMASIGALADVLAESGPVASGGSGVLTLSQIEEQVQKAQGVIRTEYMLGHLDRVGKNRGNLNALKAGQTGDPIADAVMAEMMPAEKDRLVSALEAEVKRAEEEWRRLERERRAEAQLALRDQFANDLARAQLGLSTSGAFTPETVADAYGAERGVVEYDRMAADLRHATTLGEVGGMTFAEQDELLATRPDPASDTFAQDVERHGDIARAISASRQALMADPAAFLAARSEPIGEAWAAASEGVHGAYEEAVALTLAEQERRGLPVQSRRAIPVAMANQVVTQITGEGEPVQRLEQLVGLVAPLDGPGRQAVLAQIQAVSGAPPAIAEMVDMALRGDSLRGARVLSAMTTEAPGLPKEDKSAFDAGLDRAFSSGRAEVAALLAEWTADMGVLGQARAERDAASRYGLALSQAGVRPRDAGGQAMEEIYGNLQPLSRSDLVAGLVPVETDVRALTRGLEAIRRELPADAAAVRASIDPRGEMAGMGDRIAEQLIEDWRGGEARFVIDREQNVMALVPIGPGLPMVRLTGADGRPVMWTVEEVLGWRRAHRVDIDEAGSMVFQPSLAAPVMVPVE